MNYPDSGNTHLRAMIRLDQLLLVDAVYAGHAGDYEMARALAATADGARRRNLVYDGYAHGARYRGTTFSVALTTALDAFPDYCPPGDASEEREE